LDVRDSSEEMDRGERRVADERLTSQWCARGDDGADHVTAMSSAQKGEADDLVEATHSIAEIHHRSERARGRLPSPVLAQVHGTHRRESIHQPNRNEHVEPTIEWCNRSGSLGGRGDVGTRPADPGARGGTYTAHAESTAQNRSQNTQRNAPRAVDPLVLVHIHRTTSTFRT
jgi:hypothetical protein